MSAICIGYIEALMTFVFHDSKFWFFNSFYFLVKGLPFIIQLGMAIWKYAAYC